MPNVQNFPQLEDIDKHKLRQLLGLYKQYYKLESRLNKVNDDLSDLERKCSAEGETLVRTLGFGTPLPWFNDYAMAAKFRLFWAMTLSQVLGTFAALTLGLQVFRVLPPITFLVPAITWVLVAFYRPLSRKWIVPLAFVQRFLFAHFTGHRLAISPVREIYFPNGLNGPEFFADFFGCTALWGVTEVLPVKANALMLAVEWFHYLWYPYFSGDLANPVTQRLLVSRVLATICNVIAAVYFERVARERAARRLGKKAE